MGEAEDYFAQYGILTEPCSEGGLNVGYVDVGDWMSYEINVTNSTLYRARYRVATWVEDSVFTLVSGESILDVVTLPNTAPDGNFQMWTTVFGYNTFHLEEGIYE